MGRRFSPLAGAGASIIHTHAYYHGAQTFDWQVYARVIEGIRAQVEVSVYPSYPVIPTTSFQSSLSEDGSRARLAHIEALPHAAR